MLADDTTMSDAIESTADASTDRAAGVLANAPGAYPLPRLWQLFALAWLPVFAISGWLSFRSDPSNVGRVWMTVGLVTLALLYLLLTLRFAFTAEDLTVEGPSPSALRLRGALLSAMVVVLLFMVWLRAESEPWWLAQHAIIAAGLAIPQPLGAWVMAVLLSLSIGTSLAVTRAFDAMLLIQAAFGAAAAAIRSLTITVAQLRTARGELARLAVAEERLRFARDLHDLLGHGLSLIVLKSELARRLQPSDPERSLREIGDVEQAAREALKQVRGAVAAYRQPTLERELDAARELLAAAGVTLSIEHSAGKVAPHLDALLAWSVREGVTNVIRHSRAKHCELHVEREGERLWLEFYDDGIGRAAAHGAGHGLAGLRERASACGGVVHAGPTGERGYRLSVEVSTGRGEP
jgi:two-component system, NarL family, sensor histidine kinase DesK